MRRRKRQQAPIHLPNARATEALGRRLATALVALDQGFVMTLEGTLGAGKTALARATIRALGHDGVVVSPTYTLLESYGVAGRWVHHLDLYRLADPEELEFIGLRDLDPARDWFMIEWPEHGAGHVPRVDLGIALHHAGAARDADLRARSATGEALLQAMNKDG